MRSATGVNSLAYTAPKQTETLAIKRFLRIRRRLLKEKAVAEAKTALVKLDIRGNQRGWRKLTEVGQKLTQRYYADAQAPGCW